MVEKLNDLLNKSYSPYSNFPVAAILVTKDGREFSGVNVENASYGACICAERSAIVSAISSGCKRKDLKELNLMVGSGKVGTPCFACRQVILEFFEKNAIVRCYNTEGDFQEYTVEELCPYPFGSDDLV